MAPLTDSIFGRILIACVTLTIGMVLCTIAVHPSVASIDLLVLGLYGGVALAQGGTGPCIVVLGADQFDTDIPAQRLQKQSFFNWFYWAINIGGFVSFAFLSNLAVNGLTPYIPQAMGFSAAFGFATLVFITGSVAFYAHRDNYRRLPPPKGSAVLSTFFAVLHQACGKSIRGRFVMSGGVAFVPGIFLTTASYFVNDPVWHMALAVSGAGSVVYGTVVLVIRAQQHLLVLGHDRLERRQAREYFLCDCSVRACEPLGVHLCLAVIRVQNPATDAIGAVTPFCHLRVVAGLGSGHPGSVGYVHFESGGCFPSE